MPKDETYGNREIAEALDLIAELDRTRRAVRALVECQRAVERHKRDGNKNHGTTHDYNDPHRAAAKRASMDLTRKLAAFRRIASPQSGSVNR